MGHRVTVLLEPLELGIDVLLDHIDMRQERAGHEVTLGGEARSELVGHGSLLEHVGQLRKMVDVIADALVVLVSSLGKRRHG